MPRIILSQGDERLSVKLSLDLSAYCLASKIIMHKAPGKSLSEHATDRETFEVLRAELSKLTSGLRGDLHWVQIKKLLQAQCDPETLVEKQLAAVLHDIYTNKPYVIYTLDSQFIELLKNSIDAMVKQFLSGHSDVTELKMTINLEMDDTNLSIIVTDNAGGFAADYLTEFKAMVGAGNFRYGARVSEKRDDDYYFGGRGIGLRQICSMHMAGELFYKGMVIKTHVIPASFPPVVLLRNVSTMGVFGAQLVLRSPMVPLVQVSLASRESDEECCTLLSSPSGAGEPSWDRGDMDTPVSVMAKGPDDRLGSLGSLGSQGLFAKPKTGRRSITGLSRQIENDGGYKEQALLFHK